MATAVVRGQLKGDWQRKPVGVLRRDLSPRSSGYAARTTWKEAGEYSVYARVAGAGFMLPVGSVIAPNELIAKAYARAAFDDGRWFELTVVRTNTAA